MSAKYTLLPTSDTEDVIVFDYSSPFEYKDLASSSKYKSIFKYTPQTATCYETNGKQKEYGSTVFITSFTILSYLFLIFTAPLSIWFCLKIIPKHERLLVFRLGRVHSVRGPGCSILLPCIEKWHKVDIRIRAFNIPPQQLITADGAIVELGANVQFRVVNALHSILHVKDLDSSFRMLSRTAFLNYLCKKALSQLEQEQPLISQELMGNFNDLSSEWGVKVERVELSHVTVLKQSEPSSVLKNILSAFQTPSQQAKSENVQVVPSKKTSVMRTMLNSFAKSSSGIGMSDETAIFKLEVLGADVETFFIRFDRSGAHIVAEEEGVCTKPDVMIRIAEKDLINIFSQELSPLQAYIGGLIHIEGNIQLLMKFEMALQSVSKPWPKGSVIDV